MGLNILNALAFGLMSLAQPQPTADELSPREIVKLEKSPRASRRADKTNVLLLSPLRDLMLEARSFALSRRSP